MDMFLIGHFILYLTERPRLTEHRDWPSNILILAIGLCGRYFYDLNFPGKATGEKWPVRGPEVFTWPILVVTTD